jgi:hypothetical protein
MQFRLVPFGTDTFLADISVFAQATSGQLWLLPDGPADGAHFQQVSDNVPGESPPGFQGFLFFPNPFELLSAEHNPPFASRYSDVHSA